MSESEHTPTPGPWTYIGDHIVGVAGSCKCPVKQTIAEWVAYPEFAHESHDIVPPIIEEELPEGVTMKEHIANCKLIAAAPDLLSFIEKALPIIQREDRSRQEWGERHNQQSSSYAIEMRDLADEIELLILKIKGES